MPGGAARHPNSLAALEATKWKKGQCGNPKPGGTTLRLASILKSILGGKATRDEVVKWLGKDFADKLFPEGQDQAEALDITWADLLVRAAIAEAIRGNATVLKEIWARIDGPVPVEVSGPQGGPVSLTAGMEAALAHVYGGGQVLDVTPTDDPPPALPGPAEPDGR